MNGYTGLAGTEKLIMAVIYLIVVVIALTALGAVVFGIYCILRAYAIKKLEYRRYFSEKGAFEGQEIYLIEEFVNYSFLPLFKVDVETHITTKLFLPGCVDGNEINQEFISRFFVMPFTKIRRKHRVICQKRGFYTLESAKLTFMRIELYRESIAKLMVYPKELEIEAKSRINNCIQINSSSRRPLVRDVFSFARVREYQNGDSMNMVNQKATAKSGRIMVNESDYVLGRKILLYINFQPGDTGISVDVFYEIMEKAMEYCGYIAGEALRYGWQIGLGANCRMVTGEQSLRVPVGTDYITYMEILEGMAKARTFFGNSISYIMNEDIEGMLSNAEIFLFTTYMDESLESRIEALERQGNLVSVIDLKEVTAYGG